MSSYDGLFIDSKKQCVALFGFVRQCSSMSLSNLEKLFWVQENIQSFSALKNTAGLSQKKSNTRWIVQLDIVSNLKFILDIIINY